MSTERHSRARSIGRILVVLAVLLAIAGTAGVSAADHTDQSRACPPPTGTNPTAAYDHVTRTAVDRSADGRSTALGAIGCLP